MRYLTAVGLSQVLVPSSAFSLCFLLDLASCLSPASMSRHLAFDDPRQGKEQGDGMMNGGGISTRELLLEVRQTITHTCRPPSLNIKKKVSKLGPEWVADKKAKNCSACGFQFNVIVRRHHCRACGKLFCQHCSQERWSIPKYEYHSPVRVCVDCRSECIVSHPRSERSRRSSSAFACSRVAATAAALSHLDDICGNTVCCTPQWWRLQPPYVSSAFSPHIALSRLEIVMISLSRARAHTHHVCMHARTQHTYTHTLASPTPTLPLSLSIGTCRLSFLSPAHYHADSVQAMHLQHYTCDNSAYTACVGTA